MTMISNNLEETEQLAKEISEQIKSGGLICLYGDLGTGKTTFTKAIAENLGINKLSVKSPTYNYIRNYQENFFHIDLYRLDKIDELLWEEINEICENKKNIIVIEWADKAEEYLPKKRINLRFKYISPNKREINIKNDR